MWPVSPRARLFRPRRQWLLRALDLAAVWSRSQPERHCSWSFLAIHTPELVSWGPASEGAETGHRGVFFAPAELAFPTRERRERRGGERRPRAGQRAGGSRRHGAGGAGGPANGSAE